MLLELFKQTNRSDFQQSLSYGRQYYDLAISLGDSSQMVMGVRMQAYSLMDLGRNEEAVSIMTHALAIAERNQKSDPGLKQQIKVMLNNIGLAHTYLGNYDKALEFHFRSLVLREEEGDLKAVRNTLNNIGLVFYKLEDDEKAIQNFLRALELSERINDFTDLERLYINLGLSYNRLGEYKKAINYFNKGFEACGSKCEDNILKEGWEGLGYAFRAEHKWDLARENFSKSLEIAKRQKDSRYMAENLLELGDIELEQGDDASGLNHLKEAEKYSEDISLASTKLSVYKVFTKFYQRKNDYKSALVYQTKYTHLKDSVINDKLIKNLAKIQTNYAQRENLKTIAEKTQLVEFQDEVILRQQRQYIFVITITFLVVVLAALLFYFTKRQQKINRELSTAKVKIEEYNRELEAKVAERTLNLQQANEDLDYFIYKTSHDIRGPLVTLKGMCNIAMMDLKDHLSLNYFSKFDQTVDRLNIILSRLQIVNYINNSELIPEPIDFQAILTEIVSFERKKGLPPRFSIAQQVENKCPLMSDQSLVKIILENLVDNAIKFHNNSERIDPYCKIQLFCDEDAVYVQVEDNGIGITMNDANDIFKMFVRASERSEIGGLGLYLSRLAAERIGAEIRLMKSDTRGSVFQVVFPRRFPTQAKPKIPAFEHRSV